MATSMKRKRSPDEMEATTLKRIKRTPDEIQDMILRQIIMPTMSIDYNNRVAYGASPDLHPPGFIKELYEDLRDNVVGVSALGDFQKPLKTFLNLIEIPEAAMALMDHLSGLSDLNGREIEMRSVFGAFLHVSYIPDDHDTFASLPHVGNADVKTRMDKLRGSLTDALDTLLKMNRGIHREKVLQFLALFINKNASRAHIQPDPLSCASTGTFVNLSAIMLRLCEPFLDDPTKWNRIDPRYVFSGRLELRGLTPIHAATSEWSKSGGSKFDFTCEWFFMTARVLNLGLMELVSDFSDLVETKIEYEKELKAYRDEHPSPSPLEQQEIASMEKEIDTYSEEISCYEAQLQRDKGLIKRALSFYRAMLVWMVDLAGGFKISAPATCPINFAAIPEHFVDDAMELLIFVSTHKALDIEAELTEFMNFIIMFIGSPEFIQNPYLRAKMVQVLNHWTRNESSEEIFKGHQPALDYLVPNLLHVYANSESTGFHLQFLDKLNSRYFILVVLEYLWEIPGHQNAWKRIAKEEEKGVYLHFLNILMNDLIYALDEGLNKIMQSNPRALNMIRYINGQMDFANQYFEIICFTTEEIVAPFFLPEMIERVASMLDYFLARLVKVPENYEFWLRELLGKMVKIYVNLAKGDRENVFASAITKDGRSYNERLFGDAAEELKKYGEEEKMIDEFMELGRKAKVLTKQAEEAELALGEIPEEFTDLIMGSLMMDPVIIPNTNVRIDRPVILRHLLNKNTDPFSGLPLTADMLIPDTELKAKIDHFLQN